MLIRCSLSQEPKLIRLNIYGFIDIFVDNFLLIILVMNMLPNDLIVTVSSTCLFATGLEDVLVAFFTEGLDDSDTDPLKYSVPYRVAIMTNNMYLRLARTPVKFINHSGRLYWMKTNYVMTCSA